MKSISVEGLKIKMFTDSLNINLDELRKINSLPRQVKKNFLKISNLNLKGTGTFSLNDFDFDLFSKNKWADFSTKGKLGLGILNKNKRNKSFKVHGRIKNFKLSHLINENQKINNFESFNSFLDFVNALENAFTIDQNISIIEATNLLWDFRELDLENVTDNYKNRIISLNTNFKVNTNLSLKETNQFGS